MEENIQHFGRRSRSTSLLILLLPLCGLLLQGCGGGNGGDGGNSGPSGFRAISGCEYASFNQDVSGVLQGVDPQGRRLTYSIASSPSQGSVTITDPLRGDFIYTPNTNARGTDSFTFRVHNGQSFSDPATYQIVYVPRIMPLGDSITLGVTASNQPSDSQRVSYRKTLYDDLRARGYTFDFVGSQSNGSGAGLADGDHEGRAGWCDDNAPYCSVSSGGNFADSITAILNNAPPDVILIHIGTNHFNTSAAGVNTILDRISAWAQSNHPVAVFLARIVPTRDGTLDVTTFNNNVQAIAGNRAAVNVYMVDQQSALRGSDANRADAALMADNLHPNQAGYDRMAARWRDDIIGSGTLPRCP